MTRTVTGTFGTKEQIQNAREDLVATGIPQEKIYVDEAACQIKVLTPETSAREITEILMRHDPRKLS